MNQISDSAQNLISIVGTLETIFLVVVVIAGFVLWAKGIGPVLYRLGNGLAKRKIALFAKADNRASLKSLLLDSGLFNEKNICEIGGIQDLGKCEDASVYLVFWHDWADDINEILRKKPDKCALVVYAPYDMDRIPANVLKTLDGHRHTAITNFRGRLLSDMVMSMITTHYEKR